MHKKTLISLLTLLFLCTGLVRAQEMRTVRGLVSDENGQYLAGATLQADGIDTPFKTNKIGQFEIKLPYTCRTLTAYVDGYAPATMDATPNFILFKMKPQTAESAAAPIAAGSAAAAAAQADPQADELARLKAQREAERKAQEQARKEAQEQAKAEKLAQEKAKKEAQQQAKAQKEAERQAKKDVQKQAQEKARGKGSLAQQIDFSYAWQPYKGRIVYTNSGGRNYSTLHPLQLTYAIGWNFNEVFTLTAGAGFLFNLVSLERKADSPDAELYGGETPLRYDVPAFLNLRFHIPTKSVRPYFSLSGGIYALSLTPLIDLGIGIAVPLGGKVALNLAVSARNTPWPLYNESGFYGFPIRAVPAVTAGISF